VIHPLASDPKEEAMNAKAGRIKPKRHRPRGRRARRQAKNVIPFPSRPERRTAPLYEQTEEYIGWVNGYYSAEPGGGANSQFTQQFFFHSNNASYVQGYHNGSSFRHSRITWTSEAEDKD
jgi:hypothetical protein